MNIYLALDPYVSAFERVRKTCAISVRIQSAKNEEVRAVEAMVRLVQGVPMGTKEFYEIHAWFRAQLVAWSMSSETKPSAKGCARYGLPCLLNGRKLSGPIRRLKR